MKKGWIQANENGIHDDVAPNTLADQVYMDETQTVTVKEVLEQVRQGVPPGGVTPETIVQLANQGTGLNADTLDGRHASDFATAAQGAKADAALPAAGYTAADVLAKIVTVDGAGSGLDADKFKGRDVIPVANGGTGLSTAPSLAVNLGSTAAANPFQASPRPGVTGILPVGYGGTGAANAAAARTNLGALGLPVSLWSGSWGAAGSANLTVNGMSSYTWLVFYSWAGGTIIPLPASGSTTTLSFDDLQAPGARSTYLFRITRNSNVLQLVLSKYFFVSPEGITTTGDIPYNMITGVAGVR